MDRGAAPPRGREEVHNRNVKCEPLCKSHAKGSSETADVAVSWTSAHLAGAEHHVFILPHIWLIHLWLRFPIRGKYLIQLRSPNYTVSHWNYKGTRSGLYNSPNCVNAALQSDNLLEIRFTFFYHRAFAYKSRQKPERSAPIAGIFRGGMGLHPRGDRMCQDSMFLRDEPSPRACRRFVPLISQLLTRVLEKKKKEEK